MSSSEGNVFPERRTPVGTGSGSQAALFQPREDAGLVQLVIPCGDGVSMVHPAMPGLGSTEIQR